MNGAMQISSADRVVFPEGPITKGDVVTYYLDVADHMLPHLEGRPLTLQRFPKGISAGGFMQKNAPKHYPASIERFEVAKKDGITTYPVVHNAADIAYLANQGTITFHVWTSRVDDAGKPDRIVFDLDPPQHDLEGVGTAARLVRQLFDELGLPSIPLATGSKGYHVVVPVAPEIDGGRIASAMHGAAILLATAHPDHLTTEFRKENRRGRVFLDWMRNTPGATSVCPWSLRPRPHAPAATPITWEELDDVAPDGVQMRNVHQRIDADPLAALSEEPADATVAIAALEDLLEDADIHPSPFDRFRS
jgi:bifunctional non-homologous end joining protein LigD